MRRNIVILILMTVSFGFLVYAFYQQTLAQNALLEAEENLRLRIELQEKLDKCQQEAEQLQEASRKSIEMANEMREKAEQEYKAAKNK